MSAPKVLPCTCSHSFQDKNYGPGKRLHTYMPGKSKDAPPNYRCTVCGSVK